MVNFYKQLFIVSLVLVAQLGFSQVKLSPEVKQAMDKASADQIKADITYLADDKLKGRAPGT
ncbi:MAG: peptidase, partial [Mucilaginibacter sp.]|nr:peptidase [Mucilaginibacter sp.]